MVMLYERRRKPASRENVDVANKDFLTQTNKQRTERTYHQLMSFREKEKDARWVYVKEQRGQIQKMGG
jgi:hypothetical protein